MAFTVHPVGSASGFSEESALDSELHRLLHSFGDRMANFVVSPFAAGDFSLTTSSSSFDVDIAPGDAFTGGHLTRSDATVTKTLNSGVTSEIFLVTDDAKAGNAALVAQDKATTDPAGQYVVKLWEVTTGSLGVTGTTDFRPYVPFRDGNAVADSVTGKKSGDSGTIAVDTTGVKTVAISFTHAYQTAVDDVQVTLNRLDDTAVTFGYVRVKSVSTTGFTIEANVTTAGASGSAADFKWTTNGK